MKIVDTFRLSVNSTAKKNLFGITGSVGPATQRTQLSSPAEHCRDTAGRECPHHPPVRPDFPLVDHQQGCAGSATCQADAELCQDHHQLTQGSTAD